MCGELSFLRVDILETSDKNEKREEDTILDFSLASRKSQKNSGYQYLILTFARMIYAATLFLSLLAVSSGKIYFQEDFNDAGWKSRWTVPSDWKPKVRDILTNSH